MIYAYFSPDSDKITFSLEKAILLSRCTQQGGTRTSLMETSRGRRGRKIKIIVFNGDSKARQGKARQGKARQGKADMDRNTGE